MENRHDPSACRRILREAKETGLSRDLLDRAEALDVGTYRAEALCGLCATPEMEEDDRAEWVAEITAAMLEEERGWRLAECIGILVKSVAHWPKGRGRRDMVSNLVSLVGGLPEGDARADALRAIARRVPVPALPELLMLAVENVGLEAKAAKPVIKAIVERGDDVMVASTADSFAAASPDLAVRMYDILHVNLARSKRTLNPTPLERALPLLDRADFETVRTLCNHAESISDVKDLLGIVGGTEEASIRWMSTLAGRADRIGDPELARELLERCAEALPSLDPPVSRKIAKNLAKGFERLGDEARAASLAPAPMVHTSARRQVPGEVRHTGHCIGLVDTYEGAIGTAHLRALARLAGVAHGFGLDIALIGWPAQDLAELCERAEKESGTAGVNHLMGLLAEDRILGISVEDALEGAAGHPIATTHQPAGGSVDLSTYDASLCLLMGLGRQGLPKRVLEGCADQFELTGIGASLETAVAMGAIAQRLADL
jgi:hypothetical protein